LDCTAVSIGSNDKRTFVMVGLTSIEPASSSHGYQATRKMNSPADEQMNDRDDARFISSTSAQTSAATGKCTPVTPTSPSTIDNVECVETKVQDTERYIAIGCLHLKQRPGIIPVSPSGGDWNELLFRELPEELKASIGTEASRLLEAHWIRLFVHQATSGNASICSLLRVYLLPEDWGRRSVDRNSKILKTALRKLLREIDISPEAWNGEPVPGEMRRFDPWASAEPSSLYYLFNKLPSPAPDAAEIKCRYTRAAVQDVLDSAAVSEWSKHGEQALPGLKTRLYAYQTRSASLMLQREASPQLQLDPRLEVRTAPDGKRFYFGPRDGSFLQEPRYYEMNRGGILAETMGLGKTVICLAVILASKGHLPKIPALYRPLPPLRKRPGSLADMAISAAGRHSIPVKAFLEQSEANGAGDMTSIKHALDREPPFYEIPPDIPRMNRNTRIPPTRQLVLSSATIIVVPRNLLHQWQSEIQKHVLPGGLRILVVDSVPKRASKTKALHLADETMEFQSELPAPTELMEFDVVLFTRNRFEQEIQDGQDEHGRRMGSGATRVCNCPYIGATRIPDCSCVDSNRVYESPLKKIHWLRIIIDEGHSFSSSVSNAVLVAKQIQAERRWVVSGSK
jgi:SNF2 family DNA or RNA helicase